MKISGEIKSQRCESVKGGNTVKRVGRLLCFFALCLFLAHGVAAQGQTTGTISGSVIDADGKAVVGATVTITDAGTNAVLASTKTNSDGQFTAADVAPGTYTVTIEMTGFKKSVTNNITVITGRTYDLSKTKLEVGSASVEVKVEAGGMQVLETQNTSTQATISGRAITNLPYESRSGVLMGVLDPGAQTVGGSRNSTFEGLPKGTINITFDGVNIQDNLLKSSDGFFAINDPRIDDVEEFGITTTGNDPSKTGEGAVQMTYVSKRGTNGFHGGVWETNRNQDFNSNYYFNNLTHVPRTVDNLNEFGYKIGGPILKDKLFFFTDFDFFQFPQSVTRSRNILTPAAVAGTYTYTASGAQPATTGTWETCGAGATPTCTVNLFGANGLAANGVAGNPFPSSVNSVINTFLGPIENSATAPGVTVSAQPPSSFQNTINFNNSTQGVRRYPDIRLDYNITKTDTLEFDYHYAWYDSLPDVLNNQDATFPIAPFNTAAGLGSQLSNRSLFVLAWRRTIGTNMSNELRLGIESAPVNFGLGNTASFYPTASTTFGMVSYTFGFPAEGLTGNPIISNPFHGLGGLQGRNSAFGQIHDTYSWTKGTHQFQFGFDESDFHYNDYFAFSPSASLGLDPADPANALFSSTNLPGMSSTDLTNIEAIYTGLTGRVNGYSSQTNFNPTTRSFVPGFNSVDKVNKLELGFFGGDSWRVRPTLTFNYGLRWEYDGPPSDVYNEYYLASSFNDVWGISGPGNLFHPGAAAGNPGATFYTNDAGKSVYNKYYRALAPSVGLAWQPSSDNSWLKHILGGPGKTVIRGGYSIAYSREGLEAYFGVVSDNPGAVASQFSNPGSANSLANGTFQSGSINLGAPFNFVAQTPAAFTPTFQLQPGSGSELNAFDPNIKPPMIESWNGGVQREITSNMVLEIRYQGNHGVGLWDRYNLNETNIFENGFLTEFQHAQNNLNICLVVDPAGCLTVEKADSIVPGTATKPVADFANLGLSGVGFAQVNLPILTASFTSGLTAGTLAAAEAGNSAAQQGSFFTNSGFVKDLNNQGVGSLAASIGGSQAAGPGGASASAYNNFFANFTGAGFPANEFIVNPAVPGGAFITGNAASSTYNALVVDLRHRPSHGLQFDVNYAFSKSLTNYNANSSLNSQNFITLRNPEFQKGPAPFDTRHAIKGQLIYELPFGPNHWLNSSSGVVNRIIGGWEVNSITRFQTGQPVLITSSLSGGNTFNNNDPGINLLGMTVNQIQSLLGTNKTEIPNAVAYVPTSLLTSNLKSANPAVFQPCNVAGALCSRPFFTGPNFFRADISLVKTTKITERVNLEIRMEALNAFNDADFYWACGVGTSPCSLSSQSARFGQMGSTSTNGAYSDINTTQDPGGRIIQLVARVNF